MMAENTNRSIFSIHGITGMLIATVLLLSILGALTFLGIKTQQASATKYYDPAPIAGSLDNVQMKSKDNKNFAFQDAK
jgi:hypothetical protein